MTHNLRRETAQPISATGCQGGIHRQIERKPYHRDIAIETIEFVLRELSTKEGAFYSALDAETDGIEGAYYVWKEEDIRDLLAPKEQELFARERAFDDHELGVGSVGVHHCGLIAPSVGDLYALLNHELIAAHTHGVFWAHLT